MQKKGNSEKSQKTVRFATAARNHVILAKKVKKQSVLPRQQEISENQLCFVEVEHYLEITELAMIIRDIGLDAAGATIHQQGKPK